MIYRCARALWRASLFGFFRDIDVQGIDRIPPSGPVLLVANHTNALVDPLLVLTRLERPVTLTAKSTLARNPLLAITMRALGVIRFHRASDVDQGAEPDRNPAAIHACVDCLAGGGALCIFPEGISHSDPGLRPFRTGAARIALAYHARGTTPAPLTLVPLGLHFERKEEFRSAAIVLVGEPVDLRAWCAAHPDAGVQGLTDEFERRVRAITANFEAERDSALFLRAAELLATAGRAPVALDRTERADMAQRVRFIHRLQDGASRLRAAAPDRVRDVEARVDRFFSGIDRLGLSVAELSLPMHPGRAAFFVLRELEMLVVGLPVACWGWLNGLPAYLLVRALVRRMSTDRDHFASNAVFLAIPIFSVLWLIQTLVVGWLTSVPWALIYLASLPLAGAVALLWRDRVGAAWRRTRAFLEFLRRPGRRRALEAEAVSIANEIRGLARSLATDPNTTPS